MVDKKDGIGYIQISAFGWTTFTEASGLLRGFAEENKNFQRLFLDLRGNRGGVVSILNKFLELFSPRKDEPMFRIVMRNGTSSSPGGYRARDRGEFAHLNIIVLVDHATGSAAEIATQVLKNWGHVVLGEKTFGKGVSQGVFLIGVCTLRLTIGIVSFPDGSTYDTIGIKPDHPIDTNHINLPDLTHYFPHSIVAITPTPAH